MQNFVGGVCIFVFKMGWRGDRDHSRLFVEGPFHLSEPSAIRVVVGGNLNATNPLFDALLLVCFLARRSYED